MKKGEFETYVEERYSGQVNWYDGRSALFKRLNYIFQIPTISIAAIIPIFAVLEDKWTTVILSAILAILIGILNFGKFEEKWHNYRTTCETLKKEFYFYKSKIDEYGDTDEPEQLFVRRIESTISKEHAGWLIIEKGKKKENE